MTREEVQQLIKDSACLLCEVPPGMAGGSPTGGGFGGYLMAEAAAFVSPPSAPCDDDGDMEPFANGAPVNGLGGDGCDPWSGVYVDRARDTGLQAYDDMESYSDEVPLTTLNGGGWVGGAYVDRVDDIGVRHYDDMESYTDGEAVNGLNGTTVAWPAWGGAYVDR